MEERNQACGGFPILVEGVEDRDLEAVMRGGLVYVRDPTGDLMRKYRLDSDPAETSDGEGWVVAHQDEYNALVYALVTSVPHGIEIVRTLLTDALGQAETKPYQHEFYRGLLEHFVHWRPDWC